MSIAALLTAIWFILVGVDWLGWVAINVKLLGLLAFIIGIVWLIDSYYPLKVRRP